MRTVMRLAAAPIAGLLLVAGLGAPAVAAPSVIVTTSGAVAPGGVLTISGTGFSPGQRLAVKMDTDNYGQIGADEGEKGAGTTRGRIAVDEAGAFQDEQIIIPRFTPRGDATLGGNHTLHLLDNDPVTSIAVAFTTTPDFTTALVADAYLHGGNVTVTGTGWVDRSGAAGSQIAATVETAAGTSTFNRPAGHTVHAKPQAWALGQAETDGSFTLTFPLPDGTSAGAGGSTPALGGGDFGIRLRSGSWLGGTTDINRNLELTGISLAAPPVVTPPAPPAPPAAAVQVLKSTKKPLISGTARKGKTLKVSKGSWNADSVKVTYKWTRNGKAISGATKSSYKVKSADRSKSIRVLVTATKTGWTKATVTTKAKKISKKK